jgi:3-deoxy-D-manno-octulosonate cytidylyltransferase
MGKTTDILGVIPARWESKRFPGKSLAILKGKPLIQWVWERAVQVKGVSKWLVATDDKRIYETVFGFMGLAVMTSPHHHSGTDRIAEVVEKNPAEIIINVQGDEPLLEPSSVEAILSAMELDSEAQVGTAAFPIHSMAELDDPNVVKVLIDLNHRALAFSRSPIPYVRDSESLQSWLDLGIHYCHLGCYVYRREALLRFAHWEPGPLEQAEKLEQLRFLEHGIPMICTIVSQGSPGVDTPEDLQRIERMIS